MSSIKDMPFTNMLNVQVAFAEDIVKTLPTPKWSNSLMNNMDSINFLVKNADRDLLPAQLEMAVLPLIENYKTKKASVLVGSMGIGKTTISNSIALHFLKDNPEGINVLFLLNGIKHADKMRREVIAVAKDKVVVYMISNQAIDYDTFMSFSEKKRKSMNQGKLNLIRVEDINKIKKEPGKINYFLLSKDEDKRSFKREQINSDCCPKCSTPIYANSTQLKKIKEEEKIPFLKIKKEILAEIEENSKKRWAVKEEILKCKTCDEKLFNARGNDISIAEKIKRIAGKVTNKLFDFAIIDEVHDMQDPDSWQTKTYRSIVKTSKKVLIMTGTLSNGKASSVFHILYPIVANEFKKYGGFDYEKIEMFIDFFGARRSYLRRKKNATDLVEGKAFEIAKINDRIVSFLMPYTVWMSIADLNIDMPDFKEHVEIVNIDAANSHLIKRWENRIHGPNSFVEPRDARQDYMYLSVVSPRMKIFEDAIVYRMNNFNREYEHKILMTCALDNISFEDLKDENTKAFVSELIRDSFMRNMVARFNATKNPVNINVNTQEIRVRNLLENNNIIMDEDDLEHEDDQENEENATVERTVNFLPETQNMSILEFMDFVTNTYSLDEFKFYEKKIKNKEEDRYDKVSTCDFYVAVKSPVLDENIMSSKEEKLISILHEEIASNRRVLLYTDYNGANNIQERLKNIIERHDISVQILESNVKAANIEKWLIASTADVVIVNQTRVATGLDLVMFHTTLFYELSSKLRIVQQAKVRPWRPVGQTKSVKAIYLGFNEYQQAEIASTGRKMRAAAAIEGDVLNEDSIAYIFDYSPEVTKAIAEITNKITDDSLADVEIKKKKYSEIQTYFLRKIKFKKYMSKRINLKNSTFKYVVKKEESVKKIKASRKNKVESEQNNQINTDSLFSNVNAIKNEVEKNTKIDIVKIENISLDIIDFRKFNKGNSDRVKLRRNFYKEKNKEELTCNNVDYGINEKTGQAFFVF